MSIFKISWIVCGIIWAVVILGFFGLVIFNRFRNRKGKDD